jgi:uncharacterized protein with PQ loop repeat
MTSFLGIISGLLFALAALPQAIKSIKHRKHLGTPVGISFVVLAGNITSYLYLLLMYGFNLLLFFNYTFSTLCWSVLFYYGVRKNNERIQ